jgi:hypothetical protein
VTKQVRDALSECDEDWVRVVFPAANWTVRCYRRPSDKWTVIVQTRRGQLAASGHATYARTARTAHRAALAVVRAASKPMGMMPEYDPAPPEPLEPLESEYIRIRRDGWVKPAGS